MKIRLLGISLLLFFQLVTAYVSYGAFKTESSFIENKGQIINQNSKPNKDVKYIINRGAISLLLMNNYFSYEIIQKADSLKKNNFTINRVDVKLVGANKSPIIESLGLLNTNNFYVNNASGLIDKTISVNCYNKIIYKDIYPNIDLVFTTSSAKNKVAEYTFVIKPYGNINNIKFQYKGCSEVSITDSNSMLIAVDNSNISNSIPISYIDENKESIHVAYKKITNNSFGFQCKEYDKTQTLIIDPWITYLGGNNNEDILAVSFDNNENIYCTGYTNSTNNIATIGAYQTVLGGSRDVFIAKYDTTGQKLWGTYYGGTNQLWR